MYIDERTRTSMVKKIGILICGGFIAAIVVGSLASLIGAPAPSVVQASERVTFWNRPLSPQELSRLNQPRDKISLSEIESALNLKKKAPSNKAKQPEVAPPLTGVTPEELPEVAPERIAAPADIRLNRLLPGESEQIKAIAREAAALYQIDPRMIRAVIAVESRFNPRAVSGKGAAGLMQLIPSTASQLGVVDVFNPHQNVHGGAQYLRLLKDEFSSWDSALSAYNAGPQRVRDRTVPAETTLYVSRVLGVYRELANS